MTHSLAVIFWLACSREYIAGEDRHHQEMFSKFKKTHNKKYADKKEHSLRWGYVLWLDGYYSLGWSYVLWLDSY